ncbi:MAG TPA: alpha-1,4-glucan--maltose-1-phosphate maltosyltransferase [Vicinamibacterales bacterium]|nr:alpha-1,4-glucan--maltose-1-phosphate maltosyltransferase [Vicinamibacterales bacterium]
MPRSSRQASDRDGRATSLPLTGDSDLPTCNRPRASVRRVVVEGVRPAVDGGRFPIKRTVGESVEVDATVFADGHDRLTVVLEDRRVDSGAWREIGMVAVDAGVDRWAARFSVDAIGWHEYRVAAWIDRFGSWRHDLEVKSASGHDVSLELLEGAQLVRDAAARAGEAGRLEKPGHDSTGADTSARGLDAADWLIAQADRLSGFGSISDRVAAALADDLRAMMTAHSDRSRASRSRVFRVWVDRERARFGAWYEMFPRSAGPDANRSATFREAMTRLPAIADLGFDVLYLPPIHPIGVSFRKGRNNRLVAEPGDPGSPWAIGAEAGGHTAIDPGLGSFDDFHAFRDLAQRLRLEIALDLAWQCSPDHPWVREHPDWFRQRPDGTIKYAENPPKRYQDIYPLDFECDDWAALWRALRDVALFWIDQGIRIFRVDNPHTKAFPFWKWFIDEIRARQPETIFLSEAFTRPAPMHYLAKAGFTQSYTYFTWRNSKAEITEYFTDLSAAHVREYLRPNLFANTPDILHAYLQVGGRPAFEARLLLAAALGASYGIYSGFELAENRAVPGTEEYADSEKYQLRQWDWDRVGHIKELVARVNSIRRRHRALQSDWTLRFHATDNPEIIAFSKSAGNDTILTVVNLDPRYMQHGWVECPLQAAGQGGKTRDDSYLVRDLLDDTVYEWRGTWNYVRFDPGVRQGHMLRLERQGFHSRTA